MNKLDEVYEDEDYPMEVEVPFYDDDGERDDAYFGIRDKEHHKELNKLAAQLYTLNGYIYLPEDDFFGSQHPQEYGCFIQACLAHIMLKGHSYV